MGKEWAFTAWWGDFDHQSCFLWYFPEFPTHPHATVNPFYHWRKRYWRRCLLGWQAVLLPAFGTRARELNKRQLFKSAAPIMKTHALNWAGSIFQETVRLLLHKFAKMKIKFLVQIREWNEMIKILNLFFFSWIYILCRVFFYKIFKVTHQPGKLSSSYPKKTEFTDPILE